MLTRIKKAWQTTLLTGSDMGPDYYGGKGTRLATINQKEYNYENYFDT